MRMTIQEMLRDLEAFGFSQREIAEKCGTSQPNISRAINGTAVRYELGKCIEEMHKKARRSAMRKAAA
jgi:predicted XRE-type DNA-binding protein